MDSATVIIILFAAGIVLLVAEIFLPSHALLSIVGLALLIVGIVRVFSRYGETPGLLSIAGSLVTVPSLAFLAVKYWHRTPLGRRISPPNPVVKRGDAFASEELEALIGRFGRALTPLRPVGSCEFGGRKLECTAELGIIGADTVVEATAVQGRTLVVRPRSAPDQAQM
ncbi:MAG TPA: NfeD family protein [Phycisphaerae bacterium]